MTVVFATIYGPAVISRAVQALAPHEGNVNTLVLRALEEPVTATLTRRSYRSGKY